MRMTLDKIKRICDKTVQLLTLRVPFYGTINSLIKAVDNDVEYNKICLDNLLLMLDVIKISYNRIPFYYINLNPN